MEQRLYNHHHGMHSNNHSEEDCIYIATDAEIRAAAANLDGAQALWWCETHGVSGWRATEFGAGDDECWKQVWGQDDDYVTDRCRMVSGWFVPDKETPDVAREAAANLDGAEVREAVPVLPGGPPRWLDAKGPGRYLVIPLPDKETP